MSDLANRCQLTIDYRSKGYVEDAMDYAKWILRLKSATPADRRKMFVDLGAGVPRSVEDEISAWRVELIETGLSMDPKAIEMMGRLLEVIAELRIQLGHQSVGNLPL